MEYIIGALVMALLFAAFIAGYYIGSKSRPAHKPKEADELEIRKAKEIRKGFTDMMSYDVTQALRGKG